MRMVLKKDFILFSLQVHPKTIFQVYLYSADGRLKQSTSGSCNIRKKGVPNVDNRSNVVNETCSDNHSSENKMLFEKVLGWPWPIICYTCLRPCVHVKKKGESEELRGQKGREADLPARAKLDYMGWSNCIDESYPLGYENMAMISAFTATDKTAHNSRKFAFTLSPSNYGYWKNMIEPFLITNNLMGYADGSIPCPSKTLPVTEGATVPKENLNYPIWISNTAHEYADALAAIGEPVEDKDLVMLAVSGLREEYNDLKTTITARQSPTAFSELHSLLSDHDYMLGKTRAPAPSITPSFTANYAVGSSSIPDPRQAQLSELAAQLSALGFQVSPIAPSGLQAFCDHPSPNSPRSPISSPSSISQLSPTSPTSPEPSTGQPSSISPLPLKRHYKMKLKQHSEKCCFKSKNC
ncbi:ribonuclease H-like domain-containing protein [Artemisia annua]|uniref:Ribonuclease H-like domain-containing protein n=1 Tax=Artemisia annua TaxID=35608 RepID=A0A2U1P8A9_ARTAN|nr:ribonuclease H-like domain-containing protein [Artemisia annua]